MSELRDRLRDLGVALSEEAEASLPAPDFDEVLARMDDADVGAEVIAFPGATESRPAAPSSARPSAASNLRWAMFGAAACALLLLLVGLTVSGVRALSEASSPAQQAPATEHRESRGVVAPERSPRPVPRPSLEATQRVAPAAPQAVDAAASQPRNRPAARPSKPKAAPAVPPVPPVPSWADKNAEALRAWRAGDRRRAQAIFEDIAAHGPTRMAQLAWGELSTLAYQLEGAEAQRAVRRAYLKAYPKGRFADDWSAALCRDAPAPEAAQCWGVHRRNFPDSRHAPIP